MSGLRPLQSQPNIQYLKYCITLYIFRLGEVGTGGGRRPCMRPNGPGVRCKEHVLRIMWPKKSVAFTYFFFFPITIDIKQSRLIYKVSLCYKKFPIWSVMFWSCQVFDNFASFLVLEVISVRLMYCTVHTNEYIHRVQYWIFSFPVLLRLQTASHLLKIRLFMAVILNIKILKSFSSFLHAE